MRSMTITEMKKANGGTIYVCTKCGEMTYFKFSMSRHFQADHLSDTVTALKFNLFNQEGTYVSWTIE